MTGRNQHQQRRQEPHKEIVLRQLLKPGDFAHLPTTRRSDSPSPYWSDVNFTASTVRVSHKPDRNWTPKAYKEREIPIPAKLAKKLKAWKANVERNLCSQKSSLSSSARPAQAFRQSRKSSLGLHPAVGNTNPQVLSDFYEHEELDNLFNACNEEERLWYEFFLMTGMREQEAVFEAIAQ